MKKISSKKILILIVVSGISIVYLLFSTNKSPNNTQTNTQLPTKENITSTGLQISLSPNFILPNTSGSLKSYSINTSLEVPTNSAIKIADFFNLEKSRTGLNFWSNNDQSELVFFENNNNTITYSIDLTKKPVFATGNKKPQLSLAIREADQYIDMLGLANKVSPQLSAVSYKVFNSTHTEPGNSTNYDLITIPFVQNIDGLPALINSNYFPLLLLTFGQENSLIKLQYTPNFFTTSTTLKSHRLITKNEVENNITNNNYQIINFFTSELGLEYQSLSTFEITLAEYQYRINTQSQIAHPYLILYAHPTNTDHASSYLLIAMPIMP